MKKYLKFCEKCDRETTFRIGKKIWKKRDRIGIKREYDQCINCKSGYFSSRTKPRRRMDVAQ